MSPKLPLIFIIIRFANLVNEDKTSNKDLLNTMHISEDSGGEEPYFVFVDTKADPWVSKSLNQM